VSAITIYGVVVLTFMMIMYALERRDRRFVLAFALGCALSSSYGAVRGFASCVGCGGPLARPRHLRCPDCWKKQPSQSGDTRRRRGEAIALARSAQEQWRRENPDAVVDRDFYRCRILPGLASAPLREIVSATGGSKSSASSYRSGHRIPHPMYWCVLARLVGKSLNDD
jgi:hypothetical protein